MMRKICALDEIPAGGCKEFSLQHGEHELSCFLVHCEGQVTAYRNRCPHTGAPLNWNPDVFLNVDGTRIQCDIHGAQFRIDDGHCLYGPCVGRALEPVAVVVRDGEIWVQQEDIPLVP